METFEDIQNVGEVKAGANQEIKREIFESDYKNLETGYNETTSDQIVGKFEMVQLYVKKEINEELIINENVEDDFNLSDNEVPSSSDFQNMKKEDKENGNISLNVSMEIDSQSLHSETDLSDGRKKYCTIEKPYKCDVCQKTFKWPSRLKIHHRVHSNDRPFTCDICQKSYIDKCGLKNHQLIHTGDRPFACKTCHKTFRGISHIKTHLLIHTGQKPFTCDICQKSFNQISSMKRHRRAHSDNRTASKLNETAVNSTH